jgi:hypothetical protein
LRKQRPSIVSRVSLVSPAAPPLEIGLELGKCPTKFNGSPRHLACLSDAFGRFLENLDARSHCGQWGSSETVPGRPHNRGDIVACEPPLKAGFSPQATSERARILVSGAHPIFRGGIHPLGSSAAISDFQPFFLPSSHWPYRGDAAASGAFCPPNPSVLDCRRLWRSARTTIPRPCGRSVDRCRSAS